MAPTSRRGFVKALAGSALFAPLAANAESRRNEAELFEVTHTELKLNGLAPEHDGLRIAQLSDIHVGRNTPDGRIISAVRKVNELKPDVVILTGDYVTTRRDPFDRVPQLLKDFAAPTFVVLGNHDHWSGADRLTSSFDKLGYAMLRNQHTVVDVKGSKLTIFGIDDGITRHDDVEATFRGAPKDGTRLVLAHAPTTADKLPASDNLAQFSGHTHGGQFFIPGFTESIYRQAGQPYVRGRYDVRGNHLYVNRGLGFGKGGPLFRFGSDPELSMFTLRRA